MAGIKVPVQIVVSGAEKLRSAFSGLTDKATQARAKRDAADAARALTQVTLREMQRGQVAELRLAQQTALAKLRGQQVAANTARALAQKTRAADLRSEQADARSKMSFRHAQERIELAQRLSVERGHDRFSRAAARAELQQVQARERAVRQKEQASQRDSLAGILASTNAIHAAKARAAVRDLAQAQQAARQQLAAQQALARGGDGGGAGKAGKSTALSFIRGLSLGGTGATRAFNSIVTAAARVLPPGMRAVGGAAGRALSLGLKGVLVAGGIVVAATAAAAIQRTLSGGLNRLLAIDDAKALFRGLKVGAKETNKILNDTMDIVIGTRFSYSEAAKTAAQFTASGLKSGKEINKALTLTADAAQLSGRSFQDMGRIFNKVAADNRIQGREFAQLSDAGIPIVQNLGKELGKTSAEVRTLGREGKINFDQFLRAMDRAVGGAAKGTKSSLRAMAANVGIGMDRVGAAFLSPGLKQAPRILKQAQKGLETLEVPAGRLGKTLFGGKVLSTKSIQGFFGTIRNGLGTLNNFAKSMKKFGKIKEFDQLKGAAKDVGSAIGKFGTAVSKLGSNDDFKTAVQLAADFAKFLRDVGSAAEFAANALDRLPQLKGEKPGAPQQPRATGIASGAATGQVTTAVPLDTAKLKEQMSKAGAAMGGALVAGTTAGVTTSMPGAVPTIGQQFTNIINGVKALFGIHSPSTVFAAIGGDVVRGFIQGLLAAFTAVPGIVSGLFSRVVGLAKSALTNMSSLGSTIGTALSTAFASAKAKASTLAGSLGSAGSRAGSAIASGISKAAGAVGAAASRVIGAARSKVSAGASAIGAAGSRAGQAVASGIGRAVGAAGGAAGRIVSAARSRIAPLASNLSAAGAKAGSALAGKLRGAAGAAGSAANAIASRAKNAIRGMTGAFHSVGSSAGSGLARGILSRAGSIASAAAGVVRRAINAARSEQNSKSPSKVYASIGKDAGDGYALGLVSTTATVAKAASTVVAAGVKKTTASLVTQAKSVRVALARAQASVEALADARSSFTSSFQGSADRLLDFSSLKTPEAIAAKLSGNLDKAKEFATVLAQLRAAGLGDAAFQQLAEAGADAGLSAANAISSGGPAMIAQVNGLLKDIKAQSAALGTSAAKSLFDAGQQAAAGLVKGLSTRQNALIAAAKKISAKMVAAVRAALGINSPSKVFASKVGRWIPPGIVGGAEKELPAASRRIRKLALNMAFPPKEAPRKGTFPPPPGDPGGRAGVAVQVDQHFYGPTTGPQRVRDLDWTLRYGVAPALDGLKDDNLAGSGAR